MQTLRSAVEVQLLGQSQEGLKLKAFDHPAPPVPIVEPG